MTKTLVTFKIRRFDRQESEPDKIDTLEVERDISYEDFKNKVREMLSITAADERVLKVRNCDDVLIPLMNVLDLNETERPAILEVTKIHQGVPAAMCESNMNSVYMDAVRSKLQYMESRISRIESMSSQINRNRKDLVEHTANSLVSRIAFLDRRIDELIPPEWNDKIKKSMS